MSNRRNSESSSCSWSIGEDDMNESDVDAFEKYEDDQDVHSLSELNASEGEDVDESEEEEIHFNYTSDENDSDIEVIEEEFDEDDDELIARKLKEPADIDDDITMYYMEEDEESSASDSIHVDIKQSRSMLLFTFVMMLSLPFLIHHQRESAQVQRIALPSEPQLPLAYQQILQVVYEDAKNTSSSDVCRTSDNAVLKPVIVAVRHSISKIGQYCYVFGNSTVDLTKKTRIQPTPPLNVCWNREKKTKKQTALMKIAQPFTTWKKKNKMIQLHNFNAQIRNISRLDDAEKRMNEIKQLRRQMAIELVRKHLRRSREKQEKPPTKQIKLKLVKNEKRSSLYRPKSFKRLEMQKKPLLKKPQFQLPKTYRTPEIRKNVYKMPEVRISEFKKNSFKKSRRPEFMKLENRKTDFKKPEYHKKADALRRDTKKPELKKMDMRKTESRKIDRRQPAIKKSEPSKPQLKKNDFKKTIYRKPETKKTSSKKSQPLNHLSIKIEEEILENYRSIRKTALLNIPNYSTAKIDIEVPCDDFEAFLPCHESKNATVKYYSENDRTVDRLVARIHREYMKVLEEELKGNSRALDEKDEWNGNWSSFNGCKTRKCLMKLIDKLK